MGSTTHTVRDDIWTEKTDPETGETTREHSYGEPYELPVSESDQRFARLMTGVGVLGAVGVVAAIVALVAS